MMVKISKDVVARCVTPATCTATSRWVGKCSSTLPTTCFMQGRQRNKEIDNIKTNISSPCLFLTAACQVFCHHHHQASCQQSGWPAINHRHHPHSNHKPRRLWQGQWGILYRWHHISILSSARLLHRRISCPKIYFVLANNAHGKDARNRKIQYSEKTQPKVRLQQTAKIKPQKDSLSSQRF